MILFKRKKKKFLITFDREHLLMFIKDILTTDGFYEVDRFFDRLIILTNRTDPFEIQDEIYKWLAEPRRKERREIELYCTCLNNAVNKKGQRPVNEGCPLHGIIHLITEEGS